MDDCEGPREAEISERLRRLLDGGRLRWHPAPDDPLLFVLDDGTGDVELRARPVENGIETVLVRLDREVDRFEVSLAPSLDGRDEAFRTRLDDAVGRQATGRTGDGGKGRIRFIVSFDPIQLAGLRELAERENVPVAEVVRRAVDAYLSKGGSPADPAGG